MTILAIDTCESHCSAALMMADGSSVSRMEDIGRGHAERLLPLVEELFAEAGQTYGDIRRIAVTTGPGTFTGLRIGLSVARGLALALDVPCIGLMSLPVLAAEALANSENTAHIVTKGRGGQLFYQAYAVGEQAGLPVALAPPVNVDAADAVEAILKAPGKLAGSAMALVEAALSACDVTEIIAVNPIVLARLSASLDTSEFPPEPTYLRQADAVKAKAIFQVRDE